MVVKYTDIGGEGILKDLPIAFGLSLRFKFKLDASSSRVLLIVDQAYTY
jgi:hypothetical protein